MMLNPGAICPVFSKGLNASIAFLIHSATAGELLSQVLNTGARKHLLLASTLLLFIKNLTNCGRTKRHKCEQKQLDNFEMHFTSRL